MNKPFCKSPICYLLTFITVFTFNFSVLSARVKGGDPVLNLMKEIYQKQFLEGRKIAVDNGYKLKNELKIMKDTTLSVFVNEKHAIYLYSKGGKVQKVNAAFKEPEYRRLEQIVASGATSKKKGSVKFFERTYYQYDGKTLLFQVLMKGKSYNVSLTAGQKQ